MDPQILRQAVRSILAELPEGVLGSVEPEARPVAGSDARTSDPSLFPHPAAASAIQPPAKLALAADHGGVELKDHLRDSLRKQGYTVVDLGTHGPDAVDYPDFAFKVADMVARGEAVAGIMVDGVGIGSCMTANKVPGVRAAHCYETFSARNSREHNASNLLCLGGRMIGSALADDLVAVWLKTPFGGGRHEKRVTKIQKVERRFLR